jgi:hypothetical protein
MEPCKYIALNKLGIFHYKLERPQQGNKFIKTHLGILRIDTALTGVSVSGRTVRRFFT